MMRAVHTDNFDCRFVADGVRCQAQGTEVRAPEFCVRIAFLSSGRATRRLRSVSRRLRPFEDDLNVGGLSGVDVLMRIRE